MKDSSVVDLESSKRPNKTVASENALSIAAGIVLAVVGIAYFLGMPVIIGLMMDGYQLSAVEAGYLSSFELAGTALASVLVSVLIARVSRRNLAFSGLTVAIIANLLTTAVTEYNYLLAARLMAGIGSGVVYATGIAFLASMSYSTRNFSILIFVQVSLGTLELYSLPLLVDLTNVNAIFFLFAAVYGVSIMLLPAISPKVVDGNTQESEQLADAAATPQLTTAAGLGLFAIFAFYLTVGSFWAYIERYGVDLNIAERQVSELLAIGNVVSLLGCVIAYVLSNRFSAVWPLVVGLLLVSLSSMLLGLHGNLQVYAIATFVFMICWNVIDVTQLGLLGELDRSGRMVALAPACQAAGTTLGPAAASSLLASGYVLSDLVTLNAGPAFLAFVCILLARYFIKPMSAET